MRADEEILCNHNHSISVQIAIRDNNQQIDSDNKDSVVKDGQEEKNDKKAVHSSVLIYMVHGNGQYPTWIHP